MCELIKQGFEKGACTTRKNGEKSVACKVGVKGEDERILRLIESAHLSRPENYFSIYQSGCNFSCRKCHSWYFTQVASGGWYSQFDILEMCREYEKEVTLREPRSRATAWHAHDTCRCCGSCILYGKRSRYCPRKLELGQIIFSPQGYGPARNIAAFTGGDLTCKPDFYCECATLIKEETNLWVLIETNGYGLTPTNLDLLAKAGVDSFWLDIKAYDDEDHKWLTGCSNERILKLPEEILSRGFVLEVLSLYIPGLVEADQLYQIAKLLAKVDEDIPFTILAFFPEHKMMGFRSPNLQEMINAFTLVQATGLKNIRLGNVGVFARGDADFELLEELVGVGRF
jgi:pyruvate-formate lyase-activating enzyme